MGNSREFECGGDYRNRDDQDGKDEIFTRLRQKKGPPKEPSEIIRVTEEVQNKGSQ